VHLQHAGNCRGNQGAGHLLDSRPTYFARQLEPRPMRKRWGRGTLREARRRPGVAVHRQPPMKNRDVCARSTRKDRLAENASGLGLAVSAMPEAPLDASFGRQADVALAGECAAATSLSLPAGSRPAPNAARLGRTWPPDRVELQSWIELAPVAPHRHPWPGTWASARSACDG
jgi:hypothetical protein